MRLSRHPHRPYDRPRADTPPDPRFASFPRADARKRRLASLYAKAVRTWREGDVKRDNIGFMLGSFEALRRDDRRALLAMLDPGVAWQGLEDEWLCSGPDEVVVVFIPNAMRHARWTRSS